jgi:simple sugar transport system permease protein
MNNKKLVLIAMVISAGVAGIGGAIESIGTMYRLVPGYSPGYGFDAIGAAVLGKQKPLGTVVACLLFAIIRVGAGAMQRNMGVPYPLVGVLRGTIILFVVLSSYVARRLSIYIDMRY